MSTVWRASATAAIGRDYFTYMASPYNVARTLLLSIADVASELRAAREQRRRDVQPRVHRGCRYALIRAWATVVQRDLQVQAVLGDVYSGRPVVYTTFLAYDEVAHHSGDRAAGDARRPAPGRPADRARSRGRHASTRRGRTRSSCCPTTGRRRARRSGSATARRSTTSCVRRARPPTWWPRTRARTRRGGGWRRRSPRRRRARPPGRERSRGRPRGDGPSRRRFLRGEEHVPEVSVMASGCLGLITFPRLPGRVTSEQLDALYPRLLPALIGHPGVGFVLVRCEAGASVVLGAAGAGWLFGRGRGRGSARAVRAFRGCTRRTDGRVRPLPGRPRQQHVLGGHRRGRRVRGARRLARRDGRVAVVPVRARPARFALPESKVVGAEAMHRVLRGWLAALGHDGY